MNRTPETKQSTITLTETHRHFLGVLIRNRLRIAILEAEDVRSPVNPQKKESLKGYFSYFDEIRKLEAEWAYFLAWQRRRIEFFKFPYIPTPERKWARKKITGKMDRLANKKIINPLYKIYTKIEGKEPEPSQPWLGELLTKATLEEETTKEVYSFLSQFGLDPKTLVEEVYEYLDREIKK